MTKQQLKDLIEGEYKETIDHEALAPEFQEGMANFMENLVNKISSNPVLGEVIPQLIEERKQLGIKLLDANVQFIEYDKYVQKIQDQIKMVEARIDKLLLGNNFA